MDANLLRLELTSILLMFACDAASSGTGPQLTDAGDAVTGTHDAATAAPGDGDAGPADADGKDDGGEGPSHDDGGVKADASANPPPRECRTEEPPADFQDTLHLTWQEMVGAFEGRTGARPVGASIATFRNTFLDQVMENGGSLGYCVRYESSAPVSAQLRDEIEQAIGRGVNEWFDKLVDYDCFPHQHIDVKVVGWAVRDRATLRWNDASVPIYVGDIFEDAPQCAQSCGRFFHQQPGYDYPDCPGGRENHYDKSLWLTEGMGFGGAGGDWGQRLDRAIFTDSVNAEHQHIFLHEIGHGIGFPDYYNWEAWVPQGTPFPDSVMVAGRAGHVTEWDRWMLRRTWEELQSRWP
jgi:hypothetical protein